MTTETHVMNDEDFVFVPTMSGMVAKMRYRSAKRYGYRWAATMEEWQWLQQATTLASDAMCRAADAVLEAKHAVLVHTKRRLRLRKKLHQCTREELLDLMDDYNVLAQDLVRAERKHNTARKAFNATIYERLPT
jgi:hypothetical protein